MFNLCVRDTLRVIAFAALLSVLWIPTKASSQEISITRVGACDWTCADSQFVQLSCHQRLDKAVEACANRSLADGATYAIFGAQYTVTATGSAVPPPPDPPPPPPVPPPTNSVTLTWTAPTLNEDGTPLIDLEGYKIFWGTTSGNYPNSVTLEDETLTTYVVPDLSPGTYYFAAKAFNSARQDSRFSGEAVKAVE